MPAVLKTEFKTIVIAEQDNFAKNVLQKMKNRCRRSHQRYSFRKGVLRNFAKFTGKHLRQSLSFNKVAGLSLQLYLKRDSGTGVFQWTLRNFWEYLFLQSTSGGFKVAHATIQRRSTKKLYRNFCKIRIKASLIEPFLIKVAGLILDFITCVSYKFYEFF